MISKRASGWRWYDWLFIIIGVIVVCAAVQIVAPTSGVAHALHTGFHALSLFIGWIANGMIALAALLNQL